MTQILGDTDNKRALFEGLTRHNYFPNQRANIGELPPSITTRQFTPEIVETLAALAEEGERRAGGYDLVEYKATRYNNVPRILGLIHPKAYALLAKCIHDNWNMIQTVTSNSNSIVKPEIHYEEKRLMVMNYEEPLAKVSRSHQKGFAKRFLVQADIANCFNSIYSHAIPWAAVGTEEAKRQKNNRQAWYNELDMYQRKCKRNETQGIPIGSATSSIVVEFILGRVDETLCSKGYDFYRYIDDYTCYCENDEEAQKFLQDLGDELAKFKLTLNLKKTIIEELPSSIEDSWVLELRGALPSRLNQAGEDEPKLTATEVLTFINRAIDVNKSTPDGSVLKYAVSLVLSHLDDDASLVVIEPLLNLAWHFPLLLPLLDLLLKNAQIDSALYRTQLIEIIRVNAVKRRSDGMAWPLHSLLRCGAIVEEGIADQVIASKDCVSICLLLEMSSYEQKIVDFVNGWLPLGTDYEKDNYWLLLYQLYFKGLIADPYGDGVFDILKNSDVNFLPGERISDAERRCDEIQQTLTSEALRQVFQAVELPPSTDTEQSADEPPVF